jgi:hypothetical protein
MDPRWEQSAEFFYADMGPRPSIDYSIDREDPDGNYYKDNCRWILKSENTRRARRTRKTP